MAVSRVAGRRFGAPRRAKCPCRDWGARKEIRAVEREALADAALLGGRLVPARGGHRLGLRGGYVGASARPGVCLETHPPVLGLSNRRNCSEIPSAALAERPIISAWHVYKC